MSWYIVGRIAIHDPERYARYAGAFMPVLKQYGGRLLVSEENPEVIEGGLSARKAEDHQLASREAALAWASSPEYLEIAKDRHAASDGIIVLTEGFG